MNFEKKITNFEKKILAYVIPGYLRPFSKKNVSPFGPAIWPAIVDIYIFIDERIALLNYFM